VVKDYCEKEGVHAPCIYMPDSTLMRRMIKALLQKNLFETDEIFFLRFGLVEDMQTVNKQEFY
jgi:hypothetical protein